MAVSDSTSDADVVPRGDERFRALMESVRAGSVDALTELLERCGPHILRVVRRRLADRRMRRRFDSQDFTQAVWASFFADVPSVSRFEQEEEFIAYLGRMAANKVVDEYRAHLGTQKRDVGREQEESPPAAHEATPSQFAIRNECWSLLTSDLTDPQRTILEMRLAGHSPAEIAEKIGRHRRSVERFLARLERRAR